MKAALYQRKVFKDLIRDAIYDAIAEKELMPGDRIIESDWAERLGSSQAPVREAIRDLEGRGVVESIPFKGAIVRSLDMDELNDIHMIRAGLETVALTKLVREATDEDIKNLKGLLDEMYEAAEKDEVQMFIDKDIEFHESIVDFADMKDLKKMWDMCNIRLWTSYGTKYSIKELMELANNHLPIYEKAENRDDTEIFETIAGHFMVVTESIKKDPE